MNRIQFVDQVMKLTRISEREVAQQSAAVVLNLLRHRLSTREAAHMATQLTDDLKELWDPEDFFTRLMNFLRPSRFHFQRRAEFESLVEEELSANGLQVDAGQLINAVFHLLKTQASTTEVLHVADDLPQELSELWVAA